MDADVSCRHGEDRRRAEGTPRTGPQDHTTDGGSDPVAGGGMVREAPRGITALAWLRADLGAGPKSWKLVPWGNAP